MFGGSRQWIVYFYTTRRCILCGVTIYIIRGALDCFKVSRRCFYGMVQRSKEAEEKSMEGSPVVSVMDSLEATEKDWTWGWPTFCTEMEIFFCYSIEYVSKRRGERLVNFSAWLGPQWREGGWLFLLLKTVFFSYDVFFCEWLGSCTLCNWRH